MAEQRSSTASPVCFLDEVPDAYAGYLTVAESHALLRRWQAKAMRPDIATQLAALLPEGPLATAESDSRPVPLALSDPALQDEIRQALPRVRDDALHRALSEIAGRL
jgi:hypothetical protein